MAKKKVIRRDLSGQEHTVAKLAVYSKKDHQKRKKANYSWSKLPPELLHLVSSHLLAGDLVAFRAICKLWRSSAPLIRAISPLVNGSYSLFPSLVSANYNKYRFYHPTYYGTGYVDIPSLSTELLGARIRFSKYGWLLLTQKDNRIFFFNPFTKAKVELPRCTRRSSFVTMSFSAPPTSSDCFVFGSCSPRIFGIIKRGESSWQFRIISKQDFQVSNCNPILHKGLCYTLDVYANIGVLDPNGTSCRWTVYASKTSFFKNSLEESICRSYLVETEEKLLAVFMIEEDKSPIHIFELSLSMIQERKGRRIQTASWRRLRTLGDKTMYLSLGGSFMEPAMLKGTNNRIYLPMIRDNQNVYYSLNSKLYKSFPGDFSSKLPLHVQELQNCCWIKGEPKFNSDQDIEW